MNILVCGTQYGSTYIRALTHHQQHTYHAQTPLQLAGILSRGSQRSTHMAQQLGVPHFTQVSDIQPQQFHLACVAVSGSAGQQLCFELLNKGIGVLCEHPVGPEFVAQALDIAAQNNTVFHVNGHFADLHAPQAFLTAFINAHQQGHGCFHYDLSVNLRTLYSGLDLLGRALGSLAEVSINSAQIPHDTQTPLAFKPVMLSHPKASISLLCQNFASAEDDGSSTFINHRLATIFPHGTLMLSETTGPLSWFPSTHALSDEHWRTYMPITMPADIAPINKQQLMQQRDQANLEAIYTLATAAHNPQAAPQQSAAYLLALSQCWQQVLHVLQPEANQ